jgi:hypothetical protein
MITARRLSAKAVLETGGLLGVTVISSVIYMPISIAQWARIMIMVPLFIIPVIIGYITSYIRRLSALFMLSERLKRPTGHSEEMKPNDPDWFRFIADFDKRNRIYVSASSEIYGC